VVAHHDLCFGCGQANLFGLQLEGDPEGDGGLTGRFFLKQDHQGPPGFAHAGIVAAALEEAMGLALHAAGTHGVSERLEVEFRRPVPVGAFVVLAARVEERGERSIRLRATATGDGADAPALAEAVGVFATAGAMESGPSLG
jgi:acyl-coenzyme A thioesterase PaaI-like protein